MKKALYIVFIVLVGVVSTAWAAQPDRITSAIDSRQTVVLKGTVSPRAQTKFDQGLVDPSMKLPYITLMFTQSPAQQAALNQLLAEQQDPASPNYRNWLAPEQFGARFGLNSSDLTKVSNWLRSQGFAIVDTARGRNWIAFSGSAAQVQTTFHTQIHNFSVDGDVSFANTVPVSIPAALQGVVGGVRGFDSFKMKSMMVRRSPRLDPDYTVNGFNFLAPADIATIFDINALYTAGFTGTGIAIAIMGQTDVQMTDIANFRAGFGLPTNNPTPVLATGCTDPGITGDQGEADLDLEWSGAVAQNASITFVVCDPNAGGVTTSLQYAISNKTAPVISMSYGACESQIGSSYLTTVYAPMIQQANTQGQTIMVSSGDSGAAGCDASTSNSATQGLAVNGLASPAGSSPSYGVVAVGGTEFNADVNNESTYWTSTNGTTLGSALSYIGELAWDDSSAGTGLSTGELASSGGGASIYFTKPSWQTGIGVPNDGWRDMPDVAMPASPDHDGYIFCTAGSCPTGTPAGIETAVANNSIVGGTSVACPVFAGIVTLLNEYDKSSGLGNINSNLYSFFASHPSAFHDTPAGNYAIDPSNASGNVVPCTTGTPNCTTGTMGFKTTTDYDQATGLGSVDAYNFVTGWGGALRPSTTTVSVSPTAVNYQSTTPVTVTATVAPSSGSGTPTGTVTFYNGTTQIGTGTLSSGKATLSYTVSSLSYSTNNGVYSLTASYGGDTTFAGSTSATAATLDVQYFTLAESPTTVTVSAPGQNGTATITPTLYGGLAASALTFTCSGLPSESTCTFGAPGSNGAVTLTIGTTAASDLLRPQFGRHQQLFYALLLPGFLGVVSLGGRKRTLRGLRLLGLIVILSLPALWLACGGGSSGSSSQSNPGTPTGNSTVTVTGTTTNSTPGTTAQFTLTVQ